LIHPWRRKAYCTYAPGFLEDTPACLHVLSGPKTHIHTTPVTHTKPLKSGLMNGVNWRAAPPTLSSSSRARFKGERGRGSIGSFSVLYRISLFSFPFAIDSLLFLKNFVSDLCFSCVRCVTTYMPLLFSVSSRPAHCSTKETAPRS
jgi:hypothetical protein